MGLAEATKEILVLQTGARRQNHKAGVALMRIDRSKEFKEGGYKSFSAYVDAELKPHGMARSWVYELMSVGTFFTEDEAAEAGIQDLYLVYQIKLAIFPTVEPQALLSGTYSFKDSDGVDHLLDFQKDHSAETLKALLAAHHAQPPKPALHSQEGPVIEKALKLQKDTLDSFAYRVTERAHNDTIRVQVFMDAIDGTYRDTFEDLNEKV